MEGREIIKTIQNLLFTHNCVIIPGFGAFIGDYSSAEVLGSGQFSPSIKRIAFNSDITSNDGLLVHEIQRRYNLPYDEANDRIEEFVRITGDTIREKRNIELSGIGTIYLTRENTLLFVPYREANFLKESYGLSKVKLKEVRKEQVVDKTVEPNPNPIQSSTSIQDDTTEPVLVKKPSTSSPHWLQWLNVAATVLIAAFVIGMAFPGWFEPSEKNEINSAAQVNFDSVQLPNEARNMLKDYHQKIAKGHEFAVVSTVNPIEGAQQVKHNNKTVYILETFHNEKFASEYLQLVKYQAPNSYVISKEFLTIN
jgi:nucleoid DNA-binding protein